MPEAAQTAVPEVARPQAMPPAGQPSANERGPGRPASETQQLGQAVEALTSREVSSLISEWLDQ